MFKSYPFLILGFLLFFGSGVNGQTNGTLGTKFFSNWSISIGGGPNVFFGDLKMNPVLPSTTPPTDELRYAGIFSLNRQLSHVFMLRLQVLYGEIAGGKITGSYGNPVNRFFDGNILEFNLNTTINLSNLFGKYNAKRFFFVYMTLGAGVTNWVTKVRDISTQQPIPNKDSSKAFLSALVIPAGLGCYFSIKDKVNLGLELTLRGVNSNQIDHSTQSNPYEAYSLLAFNITYNFNKRTSPKLTPASPQTQIGPPPPPPLLAAEIEAEKTKEKAAKEQAALPPPVLEPAKDTIPPELQETNPVNDTIIKSEALPDTNIMTPGAKGITYRVQVFAFKEDTYTAEQIQENFKLSEAVAKEFSGNWYRYTIGSFTSLTLAKNLMNELRTRKKVPDAFVVKYVDGKRSNPATSQTKKRSKKSSAKPSGNKPVTK